MSRGQVLYLHLCVVLTAATGIVFAVMKYFMKPAADEFSVVNHPLQPYMLAAHVVVAPFLVFGFGWLYSNHVRPKLAFDEKRNRGSGIWLIAAILPMTLSAYLLQISTAEGARTAMAAAHWISSGIFLIFYAAHLIMRPAAADDRSDAEGAAVSVPSPT
ncbi:MAG TPA: hypothetical protein VLV78_11865 [Thermoanaerobaculia bacterium]|nr:hypothetical protein [Thermoanaerobaculia bacterium]